MDDATLKQQRGVIKGTLTRAETYLSTLATDTVDISYLRNRRKMIEDAFSRFEDVQQLLEASTKGREELDAQIQERVDFEDKYLTVISKLDTLIETKTPVIPHTNAAGHAAKPSVKLPPITLPTFSGKYEEWKSFMDLFEATINSNPTLGDVQKLQYLKSSLQEDAATVIKNLQVTQENYSEALKLLKDRYDNKREIVFAQVRRLFSVPHVKTGTAAQIQTLLDQTNESVRALSVLNQDTDKWDTLLVYMTVEKLDCETKKQWAMQLKGTEIPSFGSLCTFIEQYIRSLNAFNNTTGAKQSVNERKSLQVNFNSSSNGTTATCILCKASHPLFKCVKFVEMSVPERNDIIRKCRPRLCYNCLRPNHQVQDCTTIKCKKCGKSHHTLLHFDRERQPSQTKDSSLSTNHVQSTNTDVLLATAVAGIRDRSGNIQTCRLLLDSGSQATLITESCVNALGLKRQWDRTLITGLDYMKAGHTRGKVQLQLFSRVCNQSINVEALIMSKITSEWPRQAVKSEWSHLDGIKLADPNFSTPAPIDILLGSEYVWNIMRHGLRASEDNSPTAKNTIFGWVLGGRVKVPEPQSAVVHHVSTDDDNFENILKRFWELEELPQRKFLTPEEQECEDHFTRTHIRDERGQFIVKLPTNNRISELGYSRQIAINRLIQVERRLARNPEYRQEYNQFMEEYLRLGHMELIPKSEVPEQKGKTAYLPHHFVLKPDSTTTNFRVVFNASSNTSTGVTLNECLHVGPKTQNDIFNLLVKFRLNKVVLKADVCKMFRQFKVDRSDCDLQRIVWRSDPKKPICDYRLNTVTYGTASAPYLATRCLQQLASENVSRYPEAAEKLLEDTYVDDLMSGANSTDEAIKLMKELNMMASSACLTFRKWSSNDPKVLSEIPESMRETKLPLTFDKDSNVKALGIKWSPTSDCFSFTPADESKATVLTKLLVSSQLAKVFDPLGLLAPVTIVGKLILQALWKTKFDWKDRLPEEFVNMWRSYLDGLRDVQALEIPRWILTENRKNVTLVGFCDASQRAYGAVVYFRIENSDDSFEVKMIASKSRVAPVKEQTLARLELQAAVTLSELIQSVKESIKFPVEVNTYTDSMIVLHWLAAHPSRWQTFVANRVAIVQETVPFNHWNHVKSEDNPADLVSRGVTASELGNSILWRSGPAWLKSPSLPPKVMINPPKNPKHLEERAKTICVGHLSNQTSIIEKFSSFEKLKRVTAQMLRLRFVNKLDRPKGVLRVAELQHAEMRLIKLVQNESFSSEIKNIVLGIPLPKNSKLSTLNPYMDHTGILRVGGRLENAKISHGNKHQIILPSDSHFTKLLIEHAHKINLHGGLKLVWCFLARRYWIVNAKNTIRFALRRCVICRRHRAEKMQQLMGSLPSSRVTPGRAFLNCGTDYAGPFNLKMIKGRGNKTYKGYICVFICMATKAVHLEAVGDMSTETFLAALKRFVSRRGLPQTIHSDCGTNFTGADNELKRLFLSQQHKETVQTATAKEGINWAFNPPAAPHHNGLTEAAVKSTKYHLKRVIGDTIITFEEFSTILCQIEACLNSRPLCAMSTDPDDFDVLTPGHFLIGQAINEIPSPDLTQLKMNRLSRWQLTQQTVQHFWQRWANEYLTTLQQRFKWKNKRANVSVNDLVVVHEENIPPTKWKMGRIIELHTGKDGLVRVVSVKTINGVFTRPIVKLTPILFHDE